MTEPEQTQADSQQEKYPLAGRFQRLVAVIIDEVIAIIILVPFISGSNYIKYMEQGQTPAYEDALLLVAAQILIFILLQSYFLSRYGQTIGKRMMGIAIVDFNTGRILPLGKLIMMRYTPIWIAAVIPVTSVIVPLIDALFIFRPDRRCIHDHIANTKVINVRQPAY